MIRVLEQLSSEVGVRGAMLVARDGFPIASSPMRGVDGDTIAAITSGVLQGIAAGLGGLGKSPRFTKFVLSTAHGRLVFVDAECDAYIVAITDKSLNIDVALLEMSGAAKRIRRMAEMSDEV